MKLMGKGGKRQISKKLDKSKKTHKKRQIDKKFPNIDMSEQEVSSDSMHMFEEDILLGSDFDINSAIYAVSEQQESPEQTPKAEVEKPQDNIPPLTKTPPPPKYLRPATRLPGTQNIIKETIQRQDSNEYRRRRQKKPKAIYSRKPPPEKIKPLPAEEMPPRDPLAPRRHVQPLSAEPEHNKSADPASAESQIDEDKLLELTIYDDLSDIFIEPPEFVPVSAKKRVKRAKRKWQKQKKKTQV